MRERTLALDVAVHLAITVMIAVVVALIGPFGTFTELQPVQRFAYWLIIIPLNWLQIMAAAALLAMAPMSRRWPVFAIAAAAAAIASVPAAFEVHWLELYFRPEIDKGSIGLLYLYVLVLSLAIVIPLAPFMLKRLMPAEADAATDRAMAETAPAEAPFLDRLPPALGRTLLCVGAEDHYLRVYTDKGDDLILFRLSDAETELAALDGLRVHRSWWVSREAVVAVNRAGRRVDLSLTNGLSVPVSRGQFQALRAAGWLSASATETRGAG